MDAFALLGMPRQLVVSEDDLRSAFREAGKVSHPDAGGSEEAFSQTQAAFATLASPSKRLKHWLVLEGIAGEDRGTISTALMDLFGSVGGVLQQADTLIRKRDEARSALARAMMEGETQVCREAIEGGIARVDAALVAETDGFAGIQAGEVTVEIAAQTARNLVFLEKWRANLQERFSGLV